MEIQVVLDWMTNMVEIKSYYQSLTKKINEILLLYLCGHGNCTESYKENKYNKLQLKLNSQPTLAHAVRARFTIERE